MQAPTPGSKFWDKMSQTLMQRGRFENMMHTALDLTLLVTFFYSKNWTWNLLLLLGMFECQYNFLLSCISFSWNLRPLWAQCLTSDGRLGKNYHDFQHTGLSAMGEASCTPRKGWLVMSPPSMATSLHQKSGSAGCPWPCKFLAVSSDALPLICLSSFPRGLLCSFASCCHPLFLFIESASFFFSAYNFGSFSTLSSHALVLYRATKGLPTSRPFCFYFSQMHLLSPSAQPWDMTRISSAFCAGSLARRWITCLLLGCLWGRHPSCIHPAVTSGQGLVQKTPSL